MNTVIWKNISKLVWIQRGKDNIQNNNLIVFQIGRIN